MLIIQIRIQRDGDIYIYIVEEREIQTRTERYRKRYLTSVAYFLEQLFSGSLDHWIVSRQPRDVSCRREMKQTKLSLVTNEI